MNPPTLHTQWQHHDFLSNQWVGWDPSLDSPSLMLLFRHKTVVLGDWQFSTIFQFSHRWWSNLNFKSHFSLSMVRNGVVMIQNFRFWYDIRKRIDFDTRNDRWFMEEVGCEDPPKVSWKTSEGSSSTTDYIKVIVSMRHRSYPTISSFL